MDTSEKYAKMCRNHPVQIRKPGVLEPGDYYWFGEEHGVHVIGFDHLNLGYIGDIHPIINFAIMEDLPMIAQNESGIGNIKFTHGRYVVKRFRNLVWIPKVDQWLNMLAEDNDTDVSGILGTIGHDLHSDYNYYRQFDTFEQKLCAYHMQTTYDLYWWHSTCEWVTMNVAQKLHKENYG